MDVEILARVQFALTIMFHYIYPPLSIGLGLFIVIAEGIYIKTKDIAYLHISKFWTKVFALTFAIGVATGIVMEFEFGTNWSTYSRYVGDVFGSALAAEGVFAFFLESGFLAIVLFGWSRVRPSVHYFAQVMVALGAHFSAIWIIVANSWMQTPAGFHIAGEGVLARAEIVDFWAMVFNPSSMDRLIHSIIGAWLAGAFLVISISAYYLLKQMHLDFAKRSMRIALGIAFVSCILQVFSGHRSAQIVARYQPSKLAAIEGRFHTQKNAPLTLFGIVNTENERVDYEVSIPSLLSYLSFGDVNAEIAGLDKFPKKDWPKVAVTFQTYHLMIAMWFAMILLCIAAVVFGLKNRWLLRALVASVLCPQIANQAGWVTAEMGRYPWIVWELLRISDGLSKVVTANQVLGSLIMFTILYFMLFLLFLYLLNDKIQHGPESSSAAGFKTHPHQLKYVQEITHDTTQ